jgi:uncharacterized membrane protein
MVDRKRHLAKACTYRVFGSGVTAGVTYVLTGHATMSLLAGAADTVLKIVLYYIHERIWYRIPWGVHAEARPAIVVKAKAADLPAPAAGRPATPA